jgi:putative CocE/NonD family hydrolase
MRAVVLRWYDRWLKGEANGVEREAPVRVFVMGGGDAHKTKEERLFVGGHWRNEHEWPLKRTVFTPWYLHADGTLSPDAPTPSKPSHYRFDPRHPVPSIGGNVSSVGVLMQMGAYDQVCRPSLWPCTDSKPLAERKDVRVFESAPLKSDMEITGPLTVELWASSDCVDTDFTAKLVDVYPPNTDFPRGVALNIGDGIVRARYRDSLVKAELMKPGMVYKFSITLYPTSLLVKRGHRLRVDISSSNFPRFDVNPNTGEALNANTRWRVAENAIWHDPDHPSRIILPVIPLSPSR